MADDRPESMMRRTEFDTEPDDPAQFTRYVKADRFYALAAERDELVSRCRLLEAERDQARFNCKMLAAYANAELRAAGGLPIPETNQE